MPIKHQPIYESKDEVQKVITKVRSLPPLVHANEVIELKNQIASASRGECFIVQGGDCAEIFDECDGSFIENKLKIILQMSLVLTWKARLPTVRIGRIAGQYGKPRSKPTETLKDGTVVSSFMGNNINSIEPTFEARKPDPQRMLLAHYHSASTLNYIRSLIHGGLADLHTAASWDLGNVKDLGKRSRYKDVSARIADSLDFMETCGIVHDQYVKEVDFFTSHEGLLLEYEAAMTRQYDGKYYNLSAHMLWIGNRTRGLTGAHVEYFRGIANPIGIKIGVGMTAQELVDLITIVNPDNEPGKVTLISRFGYKNVAEHLPQFANAVCAAGLEVAWTCDPMHGNTFASKDGYKTRSFDHVLAEVVSTFRVLQRAGTRLAGVHFELTGEHVTECVGGPEQLQSKDLHLRYTTYCDPRLNYLQSMEMSFLLADLLAANQRPAIARNSVSAKAKL